MKQSIKRMMVAGLAVGLLAGCVSMPLEGRSKHDDIRHLIEVSGGMAMARQSIEANVDDMFRLLKAAYPGVSDDDMATLKKVLVDFMREKLDGPGGLEEGLIAIYDKHFTQQEIRDIAAFYDSDTGRKMTASAPQVARESREVGRAWAMSLQPELDARMRAVLAPKIRM